MNPLTVSTVLLVRFLPSLCFTKELLQRPRTCLKEAAGEALDSILHIFREPFFSALPPLAEEAL